MTVRDSVIKGEYLAWYSEGLTLVHCRIIDVYKRQPFTFNTIGVCDGLSMNHKGMKYSLCSRELIADSIEAVSYTHLDVYKRQPLK